MKEVLAQIKIIHQCVEGDLNFCLGMKVVRDRVKRTITISQHCYLGDLQAEYGIASINGPLSPMVNKLREPESKVDPRLNTASIQL